MQVQKYAKIIIVDLFALVSFGYSYRSAVMQWAPSEIPNITVLCACTFVYVRACVRACVCVCVCACVCGCACACACVCVCVRVRACVVAVLWPCSCFDLFVLFSCWFLVCICFWVCCVFVFVFVLVFVFVFVVAF